jgi:hypothetical protein
LLGRQASGSCEARSGRMRGHLAARDRIGRGLMPFGARRDRQGNECMSKQVWARGRATQAVRGRLFTEALLPVLGWAHRHRHRPSLALLLMIHGLWTGRRIACAKRAPRAPIRESMSLCHARVRSLIIAVAAELALLRAASSPLKSWAVSHRTSPALRGGVRTCSLSRLACGALDEAFVPFLRLAAVPTTPW